MTTTFPVPAWKPLWDGHRKLFRGPEVVKVGHRKKEEYGRTWGTSELFRLGPVLWSQTVRTLPVKGSRRGAAWSPLRVALC